MMGVRVGRLLYEPSHGQASLVIVDLHDRVLFDGRKTSRGLMFVLVSIRWRDIHRHRGGSRSATSDACGYRRLCLLCADGSD